MSDSPIPSFLVSDVSKSLRSLTKNERFAWVAHQKWANVRIARFFEGIANLLIFGQKTSDLLRKPMSEFPALQVYTFCYWSTQEMTLWKFQGKYFSSPHQTKNGLWRSKIIINIERPTKNALLLSKLTNLSSEWQKGWFCRLKKLYS